MLRLEVTETVEIAHRDRPDVLRLVRSEDARRDAPLLEAFPERDVLLVQAHDLAVASLALAPEIDGAVLRDEVALEDVDFVLDLAIRVLAEAAAADRQHHPKGRVGPERQGGRHRSAPTALAARTPAIQAPLIPNKSATETPNAVAIAEAPSLTEGARRSRAPAYTNPATIAMT